MAGMKSNMTVLDQVAERDKFIRDYPEKMLGRGLNQPFNVSNSGPRKLLASSQSDQVVPIKDNQVAICSTGSENQYGDRSSSIIRADGDYRILAIIDKYSFKPKFHYFIIYKDETHNIYKIQEARTDKHITEKHGFHFNTSFMNSLSVGDVVPKGTIIRQSEAYDEYGNRMDGANFRVLYLATERNTEDSVIVSDAASVRLGTTHFMNTDKIINAYSRLLDIYGKSDDEYKTFPDIGEHTENGKFCVIRNAPKDEELFAYSRAKLKVPLMSDDAIIVSGKVVDIDVHCNDPSLLNTFYNVQLKKYYDESMRVYNQIVSVVNDILAKEPNAELDYELKKTYYKADKILKGAHFINDGREPNFVHMEITLEEDVSLNTGDKVADRYGGKGVVSAILPVEEMPVDSLGNPIDLIINSSTCVNRENPGQLFETSLNYISERIVTYMTAYELSTAECLDLILKFYEIVSPIQFNYMMDWMEQVSKDQSYLDAYVDSVKEDRFIYMSLRPIEDNMTEDKLSKLYDAFPFIDQSYLTVPVKDSNGNIRYVQSRRKAIAAMKYMYRLKQFSEDKFSATSLSATNIQNLNTKSKAFKRYKSPHSNTPIAMGTMESDDLSSVGAEYVISNLMINSVSPIGRRLMKEALTGDPFILDIQLNEDCANRNVEKLNAYQKAKGVALVFKRVRKQRIDLVKFREEKRFKKKLVTKLQEDPEHYIEVTRHAMKMKDEDDQLVRADLVQELPKEEWERILKEDSDK